MNDSEEIQSIHQCPVPASEATVYKDFSDKNAAALEDLFKILANDTRIKILGTLTQVEEMCVCDLALSVQMTPQAISNQLQRLADKGIVSTRRHGNLIYYKLVDKCIAELLDRALCLLSDSQTQRI